MQWLTFSLLSALFAAITAILAKVGVKDINSNLATAVRTIIIGGALLMSIGAILITLG